MLLFCQERAFDKKLIVSAAVPITPYKKFMKEKPLPKKSSGAALECISAADAGQNGSPASWRYSWHIPRAVSSTAQRGRLPDAVQKLPQPDFFSLYQQSKSSIGGTVPFLEAITVISAR